ncbi:MAG TPA: hypothetical protein VGF48_13120 [Thermoanaerobaculia bacterium]|jgi:mannose-1-phosphate guanylyltransferase
MDQTTRDRIRHIFLSPRPTFALMPAAELLGMTFGELKREMESGAIVAVSTRLGQRVTREELVAAAMRMWEQSVIEEALGRDAAAVLPEAIRLVELRARVPRYQRDMLRYLAQQHGTSIDDVLTRELEDVACAHAEELAGAVPGFEMALVWPESATDAAN